MLLHCRPGSNKTILVGGFNPSEKYESFGVTIPNIWKNKSHIFIYTPYFPIFSQNNPFMFQSPPTSHLWWFYAQPRWSIPEIRPTPGGFLIQDAGTDTTSLMEFLRNVEFLTHL
jgi:hypothetical protein